MTNATGLHFTKIIDSYEELDEEEPGQQTYSEKYWEDHYPWMLECSRWYRQVLLERYPDLSLKYFENYISMTIGGIGRVWVSERKKEQSPFRVQV